MQYDPSGPIILTYSSRKNGVNCPAADATNFGTESNRMRCTFREATSRINLKPTLSSNESVMFCFKFRVFSFLEVLVSVRDCQQEMTVRVKTQSKVIHVLLSPSLTDISTVSLSKPVHNNTHANTLSVSLAQCPLTVATHRTLRTFIHSSRNTTSYTHTEICN